MSDARRRNVPNGGDDSKTDGQTTGSQVEDQIRRKSGGMTIMDIVRILGGLILFNCALSYFVTTSKSVTWGYRPWWTKPGQLAALVNGPVVLTDAELLQYDGRDPTKPIYVALNGTIYDVSAGTHAYGPGGSYSFFAGKDAARAFVTGCFDTDLTPDLRGAELTYIPKDDPEEDAKLSKGELKTRKEREYRIARKKLNEAIEGWAQMFRGDGGKDYFYVGHVNREPGWLDKLPKRELCRRAENLRPKRKA